MRRTGAWLADGLILTSWLVTVGLVVVHERGLWGQVLRVQRTIPVPLEAKEQWFGVYYRNAKVGFARAMIVPEEQDGVPGLAVSDYGRLRFTLLGTPQLLEIRARTFLDADYRLRSFRAIVQAETYRLNIVGERRGDELLFALSTPTSEARQRLRDPGGQVWISGLSSWAAFHELKVGQWGRLSILNPLALKPEPVTFHVLRREQLNGQDVLVVETDYQGITATTWITPTGVVLKETSPMGWSLAQESMEQALQAEAQADGASLDLLSTVAVDVDRPIGEPDQLESLTILVEGVDARAFRVDRRPWQEALPPQSLGAYGIAPPQGPWCLLRLRRPALSSEGMADAAAPARYARPGLFVQSDDPLILAQAKRIVGPLDEPWPQAVAIAHWVSRTLTKRLTMGFPSAKDVLATRAGDCHEHTVLFTALARSVGIPTRMVAGLVQYQGRFFYHAWPEVWSGAWIPMDPTLGQVTADPTHIGLVEAEGEELVALAKFVGQIRLRILDMARHGHD